VDGAQGIQGKLGPAGNDGATGATGATGAQGVQGKLGPAGVDGAAGATGADGVQGEQGKMGAAGAQGDPGASISQPVFFCGELGNAGDTFFAGPNLEVFSGAIPTNHTFGSPHATTMTFVEAEVATPITCDIPASKKSCTAVGTSEPVAAGAAVAVSSHNPTDERGTENVHCIVYISWD